MCRTTGTTCTGVLLNKNRQRLVLILMVFAVAGVAGVCVVLVVVGGGGTVL